MIEHVRDGDTDAFNVAYDPAPIGEVIDTSRTRADADAGIASAVTSKSSKTKRRILSPKDRGSPLGLLPGASPVNSYESDLEPGHNAAMQAAGRLERWYVSVSRQALVVGVLYDSPTVGGPNKG